LANFDFDQAEGLRRMLAGSKPRIFTFLSATSGDEKGAMLVNLAASLTQAGSNVLVLDACTHSQGIASRLNATGGATLQQVAAQERALDEVAQQMPQGFGVATLLRGTQRSVLQDPQQMGRLANVFDVLATQTDIMVVDAELGKDDLFPLPSLASSEIVVQVSTSADSITAAYSIIKRLNNQMGRRPCSVLVTGASEKEAQVVYQNIATAANRYLAVKLNSMGSVPADEHLKRATHLGRAVVDAFPLAGASVAFRRLAGKFAMAEAAVGELHGISASGANLGI
jgi:flagellar biosynthesis protein FlhG